MERYKSIYSEGTRKIIQPGSPEHKKQMLKKQTDISQLQWVVTNEEGNWFIALGLARKAGGRLPTVKELYTAIKSNLPEFSKFTGTRDSFWTADEYKRSLKRAMAVTMSGGDFDDLKDSRHLICYVK